MPKSLKLTSFICFILLLLYSALSAFAQTNVSVTAQVTPSVSDIQNDLRGGSGPYPQGTEIEYEIIYGQTTTSPQQLIITATWSQGYFHGGVNNPSFEVLEYMPGSATNGYNDTPPIINLTDRTITWTISTLPSNTTDQSLRFKLRTTSNYSGPSKAFFDVRSDILVVATTSTDTLNQTYQYNYDPDAYIKSLTPAPTGTPTPTPTPPPSIQILYIINPEIRSDRAKVEIKTNIHTNTTIRYGASPTKMNSTLFSNNPRIYHFFTLDELKPETEYYFQIEAKDAYRKRPSIKSDIYTFKTAKVSEAPEIKSDSIIITSNNTVLFDGAILDDPTKNAVITIPTSTPFEFKFRLKDQESVKNILTLIRENNLSENSVLGINISPNSIPHNNYAQILEIEKGAYIGRLMSAATPALDDLIVRMSDFDGNVVEHRIGTIRSVQPMRVYNGKNGKGLENARVSLSIYNPTQKLFQIISPEVVPIPNPSYSDSQGLLNLVLPNGTYQAEITLVRFEKQVVTFTIDPSHDSTYPNVALTPRPFAVIETLKYYLGILFDFKNFSSLYTNTLTSSPRALDLINTASLILLFGTIVMLLTHIIWECYEHFLYPNLKRLQNKHHSLTQIIISEINSHKRIPHVHVYMIDLVRDKIVASTRTNRFGYATFHIEQPKRFRITLLKKGFETTEFYEYKRGEILGPIHVWMKKYNSTQSHLLKRFLKKMSQFLYEFFFIVLIVLEVIFTVRFGTALMTGFYILLGICILMFLLNKIFSRITK